jgi:hypothetical protein
MSRIIVQLDGGLVQDVFLRGTGKINGAIIVDEDVEMCDPDLIVTVPIGKRTYYKASVHSNTVSKLPKDSNVDKMVKAYLDRKK